MRLLTQQTRPFVTGNPRMIAVVSRVVNGTQHVAQSLPVEALESSASA